MIAVSSVNTFDYLATPHIIGNVSWPKKIYFLHWHFDWKSCFVVFFHEWNEWKKSTIQLNNINHSFEWFWIMWKILFMKPLKIKPYLSRYIHEEIWHDICCHYFTNPEGNTPANSLPFFYRVKVKLCKNIIFLLHYVIIIVT